MSDETALKIFGVRIAKFMPSGWVLRQALSPNKSLLFKAKDLERSGEWNLQTFNSFYLPNYLKGIQGNIKAMSELKEIGHTLNTGMNVYYACYCKDHNICHRSIVADIFERNGYLVVRK